MFPGCSCTRWPDRTALKPAFPHVCAWGPDVPHRLTLTLPLTRSHAHTRALSLPHAHTHRRLRLTLCKGPIRPGQANTRPHSHSHSLSLRRVATTQNKLGRTAHHTSLAPAVLWPRGMRIHALHLCRAYTQDSPTFPSDRSSPTPLLSRPMTSAPPASPLHPRTWTATPTPSPITARTLQRHPSAMPERTPGVSPT